MIPSLYWTLDSTQESTKGLLDLLEVYTVGLFQTSGKLGASFSMVPIHSHPYPTPADKVISHELLLKRSLSFSNYCFFWTKMQDFFTYLY